MIKQWSVVLCILTTAFFTGCDGTSVSDLIERAKDAANVVWTGDSDDDSGTVSVTSFSTTSDVTTDEPKLVLVDDFGTEYSALSAFAIFPSTYAQNYIIGDKLGRDLTINLSASPSGIANVGIDESNSLIIVDPLSTGTVTVDLNTTNPENLSAAATLTVTFTDTNGTTSSSSTTSTSGDTSTTSSTTSTSGDTSTTSSTTSTSGDTSTTSSTTSTSGDTSSGGDDNATANSTYLDPGSFTALTDELINSTYVSNTAQVINLANPVVATLSNAQLIVNGVTQAGTSVQIETGDIISLAVTTGSNFSTTYSGSITIVGETSVFSVTTEFQVDSTIEPFSFTDKTGVELSADIESNDITVVGATVPVTASVTGASMIVNDTEQNASSVTVNNGDKIRLRLTSSSSFDVTSSATLTVANESDTWNVTTLDDEIQISLDDQRIRKGDPVNLQLKNYIIAGTGTPTCSVSGSVPTGLSLNQLDCTITGTAGNITETTSVTITVTVAGLSGSVTKTVFLTVNDFPSTVLKTGQTTVYAAGDDASFNSTVGQAPNFTVKESIGTVFDNITGLEWQDNEAVQLGWQATAQYCENLSIGGLNDWRVPTMAELVTVNDDQVPFNTLAALFYWSGTQYAADANQYWYIDATNGRNIYHTNINASGVTVRCVR